MAWEWDHRKGHLPSYGTMHLPRSAGSSSSGDVSGRWSREGCTRNDEESEPTRTVCECNHLTHFAILLSPRALVSVNCATYTHCQTVANKHHCSGI